MARRPLYDLVPRNLEIHNYSTMILSARQAKIIGMGLKFRPTLKPPTVEQFDSQIQDFCRSVRLRDKFRNIPRDPNFNPRLYVRSAWCPPRENPDLEDKLFEIRKKLKTSFVANKPRWKCNLTRQDKVELQELRNNPSVMLLPADKNLGPTLLVADWVQQETLRHLHDELSYSRVTVDDWNTSHQKVIRSRERLMNIFKQFVTRDARKYLRSNDHFVNPAKFYIIPKIHKNPMVGRPIAASHSYITRPISIFVDEYAKPRITIPTVLRDSGELIQILETLQLPPKSCFLVTADVISLYPNVDTKKALIALDFLLREARAPETPLLIQLARLVFENNFLKSEFSPDVYHQSFGIAMGTPFAVTAANAFMFYLEKDIVTQYSEYLMVYKRFIDDIFLIWTGPRDALLQFLEALNYTNDRIKLTFDISETNIPFLDLFIYKDNTQRKLMVSTYQKPLNKYLYIPFESFHPTSNKKAFIKGELMRYVRNSSTFVSFKEIRDNFWKRLRTRGYPYKFLLPLFREIRYSCRSKWLKRLNSNKRVGFDSTIVFKTTFNCSHAHIRRVINSIMPDLNCVVCYKSTTNLAQLC